LKHALNEQQSQQLRLALQRIGSTMDSLIASQTYNQRICPFARLFEELLLRIAQLLVDIPSLLCLRYTSSVFLRLTNDSTVWTASGLKKNPPHWAAETAWCHLKRKEQIRVANLLFGGSQCNNWTQWWQSQVQTGVYFRRDPFDQIHKTSASWDKSSQALPCEPCGTSHDHSHFSTSWPADFGDRPLRCLGQQGFVQLCAHLHISWACVAAHINYWRHRHPAVLEANGEDARQACIDSFLIKCRHTSHETRCTLDGTMTPTWPRARLQTTPITKDIVLAMEWAQHAPLKSATTRADGRLFAHEIRGIFRAMRAQGPADLMFPPCPSGALPEMDFFSPSLVCGLQCLVAYDGLTELKSTTSSAMRWQRDSNYILSAQKVNYVTRERRRFKTGWNVQKMGLRRHHSAKGSELTCQCFVVTYENDVRICAGHELLNKEFKLFPTVEWLRAMDPDTYEYPDGDEIRPLCKDRSCSSYYSRRRCTEQLVAKDDLVSELELLQN
jgi:hypothetical protein